MNFRMKIQDAGMILEEQPAKVAEAVKLFLQGLGHTIVLLRKTNPNTGRSRSLSATPVKPAKPVEPVPKEPELVEGIQDLKIRFSSDTMTSSSAANANVDVRPADEQLLAI